MQREKSIEYIPNARDKSVYVHPVLDNGLKPNLLSMLRLSHPFILIQLRLDI